MPEANASPSVAELFTKPETERAFIQGDRDPQGQMREAALAIGKLLNERGWEANLGAYGGFVQLVEQSGVPIHPHTMVSEKPLQFNEQGSAALDAGAAAKQLLGEGATPEQIKEAAWGVRMALFITNSEGFVFFPGTRGTRAHLLAVLAFNLVTDRPKPVALVGWNEGQPNLQESPPDSLPDQEEAWLKTFAQELERENPTWLKRFNVDEPGAAVAFVTSQGRRPASAEQAQ